MVELISNPGDYAPGQTFLDVPNMGLKITDKIQMYELYCS